MSVRSFCGEKAWEEMSLGKGAAASVWRGKICTRRRNESWKRGIEIRQWGEKVSGRRRTSFPTFTAAALCIFRGREKYTHVGKDDLTLKKLAINDRWGLP